MVKKKKYKFAVLVDEYGKDKKYLNRLVKLLKKEFPFLKQASCCVTTKRIHKAKKGDVIIFGLRSSYDFRVVSGDYWNDLRYNRHFKFAKLRRDWSKVKRFLDIYAEENYPEEYYDDGYYCYVAKPVTSSYKGLRVVLSSPKKKAVRVVTKKKKSKGSLELEEVAVHHNFVRVGYDVFDIYENRQGEEYVKIDGNTYWVDRDPYGKDKLSVQ